MNMWNRLAKILAALAVSMGSVAFLLAMVCVFTSSGNEIRLIVVMLVPIMLGVVSVALSTTARIR